MEHSDHQHLVAEVAELLCIEVEDLPDVGVLEVAHEPLGPVVDGGLHCPGPRHPSEVVRGHLDQGGHVPPIEGGDRVSREHHVLLRHRLLPQPHGFEGVAFGSVGTPPNTLPLPPPR